jgi:hypothetical protein
MPLINHNDDYHTNAIDNPGRAAYPARENSINEDSSSDRIRPVDHMVFFEERHYRPFCST